MTSHPKPYWEQILALKSSAQFRSLTSDLERAISLHRNGGIPQINAAKEFGISCSKLRRALKAFDEGREKGKNGRPGYLTSSDEKQLVQEIANRSKSLDSMNNRKVRSTVRHLFAVPFQSPSSADLIRQCN